MASPLTCDQCEALLPGYLLSAVEVAEAAAVAEHVHTCDRCQASLVAYEAVCDRLAQAVPLHEPPADLRQRLMAAVTDTPPSSAARALVPEPAPDAPAPQSLQARTDSSLPAGGGDRRTVKPPVWNWPSFAVALSLAIIVTWALTYFLTRSTTEERLVDAAVSAHMYSFMANYLTDVTASEPQSVEAWFKERLPFVPPVRDLSAQGYPLAGGRLDYLYKRSVAALVYRHGDHLINVFVWPASRRDEFPGQLLQDDGFHIILWTHSSTNYCAISDLAQRDFVAFVDSYRSSSRSS
jgi:anti-sigma factor RsiW